MSVAAATGDGFARALAAKDFERLSGLLDPAADFRALTPNRAWEATGPEEIEPILRAWFDHEDEIEELERVESEGFADLERVGYRLRVRNPKGLFAVEQQAYLATKDGMISWLRILCSGFRPIDG
ncbi:hypothetical protein HJD18_05880 [Thermoleophilia bacterium SCSIO 60948]|nr:hypothetical protein HJD18_05880 [Thermoleophilia bacterium SCSIO 60948]